MEAKLTTPVDAHQWKSYQIQGDRYQIMKFHRQWCNLSPIRAQQTMGQWAIHESNWSTNGNRQRGSRVI